MNNQELVYPNPEVIITGDKKFIKNYQQRRVSSMEVSETINKWQKGGWSFYKEHKSTFYNIIQFVKITSENEPLPLPPDYEQKKNKCNIL